MKRRCRGNSPRPVHSGHTRVGSSGPGGGQREAPRRCQSAVVGDTSKPLAAFAAFREAIGSRWAASEGPSKSLIDRDATGRASEAFWASLHVLGRSWNAPGGPCNVSGARWKSLEGPWEALGKPLEGPWKALAGPGTLLESLGKRLEDFGRSRPLGALGRSRWQTMCRRHCFAEHTTLFDLSTLEARTMSPPTPAAPHVPRATRVHRQAPPSTTEHCRASSMRAAHARRRHQRHTSDALEP